MPVPRPRTEWSRAKPDELQDSIERTRERLERHLGMLKGKISPQAGLRRIGMPIAVAAAALAAGALAWKLSGPKHPSHAREPAVTRLKVRSAGIADHIRALLLLAGIIRKGKPGFFIVEPGRG